MTYPVPSSKPRPNPVRDGATTQPRPPSYPVYKDGVDGVGGGRTGRTIANPVPVQGQSHAA